MLSVIFTYVPLFEFVFIAGLIALLPPPFSIWPKIGTWLTSLSAIMITMSTTTKKKRRRVSKQKNKNGVRPHDDTLEQHVAREPAGTADGNDIHKRTDVPEGQSLHISTPNSKHNNNHTKHSKKSHQCPEEDEEADDEYMAEEEDVQPPKLNSILYWLRNAISRIPDNNEVEHRWIASQQIQQPYGNHPTAAF